MFPDMTDRVVVLRRWHVGDAASLTAAWADPGVAAGSAPPADRGLDAATAWIEGARVREQASLAVDIVMADPVDDHVMGEVGISSIDEVRRAALIGWWVSADDRGRHVASTAVRMFADWMLDAGPLDHLVAEILPTNEPSIRVALNAGFRLLRPSEGSRPLVFARGRSDSRQ